MKEGDEGVQLLQDGARAPEPRSMSPQPDPPLRRWFSGLSPTPRAAPRGVRNVRSRESGQKDRGVVGLAELCSEQSWTAARAPSGQKGQPDPVAPVVGPVLVTRGPMGLPAQALVFGLSLPLPQDAWALLWAGSSLHFLPCPPSLSFL